jgi:hypothetical protein
VLLTAVPETNTENCLLYDHKEQTWFICSLNKSTKCLPCAKQCSRYRRDSEEIVEIPSSHGGYDLDLESKQNIKNKGNIRYVSGGSCCGEWQSQQWGKRARRI